MKNRNIKRLQERRAIKEREKYCVVEVLGRPFRNRFAAGIIRALQSQCAYATF
jgi:hypothetical protein